MIARIYYRHLLHYTHIKIFIILIKLIFQNKIFNNIFGIFLKFFEGVITFAVEVWSWKLCQIKDPLVFGAANRGSVNQNIVLHFKTKWRTIKRDDQTILRAQCFDSQNRGLQHQRQMDLWSVITSKTKLPQQQWSHLQNLCILLD